MTTLLTHLDPNPWYTIAFRSFSSGREGPFGGNLWKPQLSLFSFLHPLGRKEGKGPKALQAIISQQLLVSNISVGSQFRTLS